MSVVIGIDIGTTSTKVAVLDPDVGVVWQGARPSTIVSPAPGYAEGDPEQWWVNTAELLRQYASLPEAKRIGALAVTGMVPTVILIDAQGRSLGPSIQQNDTRATAEVVEMSETLARIDVLRVTGSAITQQSVGPKLRWLERHCPDAYAQAIAVVGSYDDISRRLTGVVAVEENWALESGLWDLAAREWSPEITDAAGIPRELLPTVVPSGAVIGGVCAAASAETGVPEGTPVVAGGADHVLSALAAGAISPGDAVVKIGGAGDILVATAEPVVDERLYLDHHAVPGAYLVNGCMATSGAAIRWFQEEVAGGRDLETLNALAEAVDPAAGGVVFLPYLLGEKTPIHDPAARGAFVGLHLGTTTGHLFRAVLEGIAFGVRQHLEILTALGFDTSVVRLSDGGARSALLGQILADVTGCEVHRLGGAQSSALGAAAVAAVAVGAWPDHAAVSSHVETVAVHHPSRDAGYDVAYRVYGDLYPALRALRPEGGAL